MKDWDDMTPLEEIYAIRREIAEENGIEVIDKAAAERIAEIRKNKK